MNGKKLVKKYEHALKAEPENIVLRLKLAGALLEMGDRSAAAAAYRAVAEAYAKSERFGQALAVCRSALEILPGDQETEALMVSIQPRVQPKAVPGPAPPPAPRTPTRRAMPALPAVPKGMAPAGAGTTPPAAPNAEGGPTPRRALSRRRIGDEDLSPLTDPGAAADDLGYPSRPGGPSLPLTMPLPGPEPDRESPRGGHAEPVRTASVGAAPMSRTAGYDDEHSHTSPSYAQLGAGKPGMATAVGAGDDDDDVPTRIATGEALVRAPDSDDAATRVAAPHEVVGRFEDDAATRVAAPHEVVGRFEDDAATRGEAPHEVVGRFEDDAATRGEAPHEVVGRGSEDDAPTRIADPVASSRMWRTMPAPARSDRDGGGAGGRIQAGRSHPVAASGVAGERPAQPTPAGDEACKTPTGEAEGTGVELTDSMRLTLQTAFAGLPAEVLPALAAGLKLKRFAAGELIVREGERGDCCFVVRSGSVRVLKDRPQSERGPGADSIEVAQLRPGQLFGEFALLADRRRHASVQALGACEVLEVPRRLLRDLAASFDGVGRALGHLYRRRLLGTMLATAPFFRPIPEPDRSALLGRFKFRHADEGDVIIQEGEQRGGLYLVVLGSVDVHRRTEEGRSVKVATLGEGAFFGEMSLLSGGTASATVKAVGTVELGVLAGEEFSALLSRYPRLAEELHAEAQRRAAELRDLLAGEINLV